MFIEAGKLNAVLFESLIEAKNLREVADYYGDFSEINSVKLARRAKEFLRAVEDILRNNITMDIALQNRTL